MCGIFSILRGSGPDQDFAPASVLEPLDRVLTGLGDDPAAWIRSPAADDALEGLRAVDDVLRSRAGSRELAADVVFWRQLGERLDRLEAHREQVESWLDAAAADLEVDELETSTARVRALCDLGWSLRHDRWRAADRVRTLAGTNATRSAIDGFWAIELALNALDRLEVRGRDSAGLGVLVRGHGLDLEAAEIHGALAERTQRALLTDGAVRTPEGHLSFVYKTAQEIGELGDNVRALRRSIAEDGLLARALAGEGAEVLVLAHTRWASVGMISQPNAHPVNGEETGAGGSGAPGAGILAALNGDVDNHADLREVAGLELPEEITTDAKVIPVLVERALRSGLAPVEAFRRTVASFRGSVAIGLSMASTPDRLYLALRGSGQALYVGFGEGTWVVASEPYGLVEVTDRYLRLDGETPGNPSSPEASRGQVLVLDSGRAGEIDGIERLAYDGTPLPVEASELKRLEITTRDVERGDFPHFLLKEISESPESFRKTLRGKVRRSSEGLRVELSPSTLPTAVSSDLRSARIRRIFVIGQGTAAIAGAAAARAFERLLPSTLGVRAMPATELSGFGLDDDMSDALVVAISQSGTTTDTNRTVDLVRARGARVISIVNRRHSDLTDKSDGVLYTSDGRDVEMSVASTKAFYSQVAAGFLLACALSEHLPVTDDRSREQRRRRIDELLQGLDAMPGAMAACLELGPQVATIAARHAPRHRYWAVVGNGWNQVAAREIRIKLSELCYKSIAADATEDKKHIDLSAEPMILVCAAGLTGSTAEDVAKEIAIYRAHKATPLVVASEGEQRFGAATEVVLVPRVHPDLAFVLSVMVGHLFGYHAALAIDRSARPLRQVRAAIEATAAEGQMTRGPALDAIERLRPRVEDEARRFLRDLADRRCDGQLEASTAVELVSLLRFTLGDLPLAAYSSWYGRPGTPGTVLEHLAEITSRAIDQLTRPVDAIKHQAKTVTVGISRTDEALLTVPLVRAVLEAGADRDALGYDDLRALAALDPVVERVTGFTRYRLEGDPRESGATIRVVQKGGLARDLRSRVEEDSELRGTKRTVATEGRLLVARGRSDDRTFMLVPEVESSKTGGARVGGLVLLHVAFVEHAEPAILRGALGGYRNRWSVLRDAVMETEPSFREDLLAQLSVASLLCDPIQQLAETLRHLGEGTRTEQMVGGERQ